MTLPGPLWFALVLIGLTLAVGIAARALRVPYTVGLVIAGVATRQRRTIRMRRASWRSLRADSRRAHARASSPRDKRADRLAFVAWGVAAMVVGRAFGTPLPRTWRHGAAAGGRRGALSVALALGLPDALPEKSLVVPVVFFCVLITLIVQGLALGPVFARLGFSALAQRTT